jgi:hypothetical protein
VRLAPHHVDCGGGTVTQSIEVMGGQLYRATSLVSLVTRGLLVADPSRGLVGEHLM